MRNFKSERHLQVVNEHRQRALMTLEAFQSAATASSIKEALLYHAANTIFSPSVTGYVGGDENMPTTPSIETIKSPVGKGA